MTAYNTADAIAAPACIGLGQMMTEASSLWVDVV